MVPHRKTATCIYFVHTNLYGRPNIVQRRHERLLPRAIRYWAVGSCHAAVARIQPAGYPVPWHRCATTNDHMYYINAQRAAESQMSQHPNEMHYTFCTFGTPKFCQLSVSRWLSRRVSRCSASVWTRAWHNIAMQRTQQHHHQSSTTIRFMADKTTCLLAHLTALLYT